MMGQAKGERGRYSTEPVTCWETGVTYPSASAAAEAAGCSVGNVSKAVRTGGMAAGSHWYRESDGRPQAIELKWGRGKARPVVEMSTGRVFGTTGKAAEAFGLSTSQVEYRIKSGTATEGGLFFERLDGPRFRGGGRHEGDGVVCWETGERFADAAEAACSCGTLPRLVTRSCSGGYLCAGRHFYYAGAPRPRGCDLRWGAKSAPVIDVTTGTVYASAGAAARDAGVSVQSVCRHIMTGSHPRGGERWQWARCSDMEGAVVL